MHQVAPPDIQKRCMLMNQGLGYHPSWEISDLEHVQDLLNSSMQSSTPFFASYVPAHLFSADHDMSIYYCYNYHM